jgi:hypothetical protein
MARVALLIGAGEGGGHSPPLTAVARDVDAMAELLADKQRGGFDQVEKVVDPGREALVSAIDTFFRGRGREDVLLLYISGRVLRDERQHLVLQLATTRIGETGRARLDTGFAFTRLRAASGLCGARRQAVIFDAILPADLSSLMELGGSAMQILAPAPGTCEALDKNGAISGFTASLIHGLRTGGPDTDRDGRVVLSEVAEWMAAYSAGEIGPKPAGGGPPDAPPFPLCEVPDADPRNAFKERAAALVVAGELSDPARVALDARRAELGLDPMLAQSLVLDVLAVEHERMRAREAYGAIFRDVVTTGRHKAITIGDELKKVAVDLKLKEEDKKDIEEAVLEWDRVRRAETFRPDWLGTTVVLAGIFVVALGLGTAFGPAIRTRLGLTEDRPGPAQPVTPASARVDTDGDSIVDRADTCPTMAAEAGSEDGCPSNALALRKRYDLALRQPIAFAPNSDRIDAASFPVVDALAALLREHPDVRLIRVLVAAPSPDATELPVARAYAIKQRLLGLGLPERRLQATFLYQNSLTSVSGVDPAASAAAARAGEDAAEQAGHKVPADVRIEIVDQDLRLVEAWGQEPRAERAALR